MLEIKIGFVFVLINFEIYVSNKLRPFYNNIRIQYEHED
jgi:hypothetical protein